MLEIVVTVLLTVTVIPVVILFGCWILDKLDELREGW